MTLNTNFAGRLVTNPEMQTIQTQKPTRNGEQIVTNFRMATRSYRKGEDYFLNCHVWGRAGYALMETIDHPGIQKGDQLFINGELWVRHYETRDGEQRTALEVDVNSFDFGRKSPHHEDQSDDGSDPRVPQDMDVTNQTNPANQGLPDWNKNGTDGNNPQAQSQGQPTPSNGPNQSMMNSQIGTGATNPTGSTNSSEGWLNQSQTMATNQPNQSTSQNDQGVTNLAF